jgi:hypothetical protein
VRNKALAEEPKIVAGHALNSIPEAGIDIAQ